VNVQSNIQPQQNVFTKIAAVQGELAKIGIGKNNANTQQNYKFRGIDDVYNALAPLLAKHGLCILPRMVGREREERVTVKEWNGSRKESVTFYVTVDAEFDFVSADDGSIHVVRTYGEAMDNGDKATNKAMSAAYKYAAFMTFAIPTEGDEDADSTTHEVAARSAGGQRQKGEVRPRQSISYEQVGELQQLFDHLNVAVGDFLKIADIASLAELPASWFDRAKSWVNDRAKELCKENA
jgi:hypothetical protein